MSSILVSASVKTDMCTISGRKYYYLYPSDLVDMLHFLISVRVPEKRSRNIHLILNWSTGLEFG